MNDENRTKFSLIVLEILRVKVAHIPPRVSVFEFKFPKWLIFAFLNHLNHLQLHKIFFFHTCSTCNSILKFIYLFKFISILFIIHVSNSQWRQFLTVLKLYCEFILNFKFWMHDSRTFSCF